MSINFWDRMTTSLRARYRESALAQYGAGLGCGCGDCATGPIDLEIPAPRRETVSSDARDAAPRTHEQV